MMEEEQFWYWLCCQEGISRGNKRKMLQYFGSPDNIFYAKEEELLPFFRIKKNVISFVDSRREDTICSNFQMLFEKGVKFIHQDSEKYPKRLHAIPDPPLGLFVKGTLPDDNMKSVAIIGARDCTRYGREMARFFGRELSKAGIQIVSGLARGIDGMAHEGALEADGYTIGILGCGVDVVYPEENYKLFMEMERRGGILSESCLGEKPHAGLFPQRNRLIAGLSDGILVIEAMEKSGTFITVDQGLEQGKEIFALPGRNIDAKSRGCNSLIKMGAHMATEVSDILEILYSDSTKVPCIDEFTSGESFVCKNLLAPNEKIVYSCLRVEPQYLDEIISKTQIAPQEVCMALNHLTVIGGVVETARNYYALRL